MRGIVKRKKGERAAAPKEVDGTRIRGERKKKKKI